MQQRAQETLRQLCEVFPMRGVVEGRGLPPREDGIDEWRFLSTEPSPRDARSSRRFGDWISKAVAVDGHIENAVSTCFLEHTRQVKINRVLAPYLSPVAKAKSHA